MATRILDLELGERFAGLDVPPGYERALILLRAGSVPVGRVQVPVEAGRVTPGRFFRGVEERSLVLAASAFWQARLSEPGPVPPVTAAICTRERPDDLRVALAALTDPALTGQVPEAEILVVDNCPATSATKAVVAEFPGVRYVVEPAKGLNNARNRALTEALFPIVAFIDDDAVADPGWLAAIARPFADDRVMCVTGLTMPWRLENDAQEAFEDLAGFSKRGFYPRQFRSPPHHPLATGDIGAGANMAVRRSMLQEIGPFDPALDAGTPTQSGGDHEYMTRILRQGHMILYEPRALNWHHHRRTWDAFYKAIHGYGVGVYAAWTRSLLGEREWGVFRRGLGWFLHDQLPAFLRTLGRPRDDVARRVIRAELAGCLRGPLAYLKSRRGMGR